MGLLKMRKLLLLSALALSAPLRAEGWNFIVNPYFMAPNMDGKAGLGQLQTQVSQSPSDIFQNLNWGVMGSLEANNGNWGFNFDANYMNLDLTPTDRTRLAVTGHQSAYTATILIRVHKNAWVYVGARWSDMGVKFGCQSNCLPNGGINLPNGGANIPTVDTSRNKGWADPLIGFRAELPFNDKIDLTFNADIGGFGVGSDVTVNAWPQLGFRIGGRSKAMIGYRVIYVKYKSDDGGLPFLYDVLTFGPTAGLQFRF